MNNSSNDSNILDDEIAEFENFNWVGKHAPCFSIDSANISVIKEPSEFFQSLKVNKFDQILTKRAK